MTRAVLSLILVLALALCGVGCAEGATGDAFVGVYTDMDDGVTRLRVLPEGDAYAVTLDIYRLVGLEFTAQKDGDALRGDAVIDGDAKAVVEIAAGNPGPAVTIVESGWALLEPGTAFAFAPGAPDIDPETFAWLFTEKLTGIAGTAGATLKQAVAARDLLDALVACDAGYCDPDSLTAAIAEALGGMDAEARGELDENLACATALIDGAFDGDESVNGAFEDAGALEDVTALIAHPLARTDWEGFRTAYEAAKGQI